MLLLYVWEFTELQKQQASTTKMLEASAALLQKAGDTIGRQRSRLERERADRDEVQDRLNHLVNQVATHMLRSRDAYRRASAMMLAVGLNPFDHPVDFNELRLLDLVSFFTYISEELSHLRAMVGAEVILDLVTIGPLVLQPAPLTAYHISRFCRNAADASSIFVVDACHF